MTAVIYARYSSDNQREESIEGQIRECTAYAEKNGITVVKHYIDRCLLGQNCKPAGVSANGKGQANGGCLILSWSGNWIASPVTDTMQPITSTFSRGTT